MSLEADDRSEYGSDIDIADTDEAIIARTLVQPAAVDDLPAIREFCRPQPPDQALQLPGWKRGAMMSIPQLTLGRRTFSPGRPNLSTETCKRLKQHPPMHASLSQTRGIVHSVGPAASFGAEPASTTHLPSTTAHQIGNDHSSMISTVLSERTETSDQCVSSVINMDVSLEQQATASLDRREPVEDQAIAESIEANETETGHQRLGTGFAGLEDEDGNILRLVPNGGKSNQQRSATSPSQQDDEVLQRASAQLQPDPDTSTDELSESRYETPNTTADMRLETYEAGTVDHHTRAEGLADNADVLDEQTRNIDDGQSVAVQQAVAEGGNGRPRQRSSDRHRTTPRQSRASVISGRITKSPPTTLPKITDVPAFLSLLSHEIVSDQQQTQEQIRNLDGLVERSTVQISTLQTQLRASSEQVALIKAELAAEKEDRASLSASLETSKVREAELNHKLSTSNEEIAKVKTRFLSLKGQYETHVEATENVVVQQWMEIKEQSEACSAQVSEVERQSAAARSAAQASVHEATAHIARLRTHSLVLARELMVEVQRLTDANKSLELQLSEKAGELGEIRDQRMGLENRLEETLQNMKELKNSTEICLQALHGKLDVVQQQTLDSSDQTDISAQIQACLEAVRDLGDTDTADHNGFEGLKQVFEHMASGTQTTLDELQLKVSGHRDSSTSQSESLRDDLERLHRDLTASLGGLNNQCTHDETIAALQTHLNEKGAELATIKALMHDAQIKEAALNLRLQELQAIQARHNESSHLANKLDQLLIADNATLRQALADEKARFLAQEPSTVEPTTIDPHGSTNTALFDHDAAMAKYEEKMHAALEDQRIELTKAADTIASQQRTQYRNELRQARSAEQHATAKMEDALKRTEEGQSQLRDLEQQLRTAQSQIAPRETPEQRHKRFEKDSLIRSLEGRQGELEAMLEGAQARSTELERSIQTLESSITSKSNDNRALADLCKEKDSGLERLQEQHMLTLEDNREKERKMTATVEAKVRSLQAQLDEVESHLSREQERRKQDSQDHTAHVLKLQEDHQTVVADLESSLAEARSAVVVAASSPTKTPQRGAALSPTRPATSGRPASPEIQETCQESQVVQETQQLALEDWMLPDADPNHGNEASRDFLDAVLTNEDNDAAADDNSGSHNPEPSFASFERHHRVPPPPSSELSEASDNRMSQLFIESSLADKNGIHLQSQDAQDLSLFEMESLDENINPHACPPVPDRSQLVSEKRAPTPNSASKRVAERLPSSVSRQSSLASSIHAMPAARGKRNRTSITIYEDDIEETSTPQTSRQPSGLISKKHHGHSLQIPKGGNGTGLSDRISENSKIKTAPITTHERQLKRPAQASGHQPSPPKRSRVEKEGALPSVSRVSSSRTVLTSSHRKEVPTPVKRHSKASGSGASNKRRSDKENETSQRFGQELD